MSAAEPPVAPDVRPSLTYGALAALAAGVLGIAGAAVEMAQGPTSGFTAATALMLLAFLPQAVVLVAFVRLAAALGDPHRIPLRKSSICLAVTFWLTTAFGILSDTLSDRASLLVMLGLGLGLAGVFAYALGQGGGLGLLFLPYLLLKYPGGWLLTGKKLESGVAFTLTALFLLAVSVIGYPVWFARTVWKTRARLGPTAGVLAVVILLSVAAGLAMVGWMAVSLATAPGAEDMDEAKVDELFAPYHVPFVVFGGVETVVTAAAVAAYLVGARGRLSDSTIEPIPERPEVSL